MENGRMKKRTVRRLENRLKIMKKDGGDIGENFEEGWKLKGMEEDFIEDEEQKWRAKRGGWRTERMEKGELDEE